MLFILSVSHFREIHRRGQDNKVVGFTGAWGMDFVSSSPLFSTTPFFSKFSYKSFLFQNFHNHSFFLHLTISVDVIHHELYVYSVSTVFRLIQYQSKNCGHRIHVLFMMAKNCGHRIHVLFMMYDVY